MPRADLHRCIGSLVLICVLLAVSLHTIKEHKVPVSFKSLWAAGLGKPQPYAIILTKLTSQTLPPAVRFFMAVFIANINQAVLSACYLLLNGLITCMSLAEEWNQYIHRRKSLRLSSACGLQRTSYRLTVPYRYGIPLMISSTLMHWLASQSVFIVATQGFTYAGTKAGTSLLRNASLDSNIVGYSPIGIIFVIFSGTLILTATFVLGLVKNKGRPIEAADHTERDGRTVHMPLVSSCSAAISAACHKPEMDVDAHLMPVIWGEVPSTGTWSLTTAKDVRWL